VASSLLAVEGNSAPEQVQLLEVEGWPAASEEAPGFVAPRRG